MDRLQRPQSHLVSGILFAASTLLPSVEDIVTFLDLWLYNIEIAILANSYYNSTIFMIIYIINIASCSLTYTLPSIKFISKIKVYS